MMNLKCVINIVRGYLNSLLKSVISAVGIDLNRLITLTCLKTVDII